MSLVYYCNSTLFLVLFVMFIFLSCRTGIGVPGAGKRRPTRRLSRGELLQPEQDRTRKPIKATDESVYNSRNVMKMCITVLKMCIIQSY